MLPHEMETLIRNIDLRTARIERILPSLAAEEELAALGRKIEEELAALEKKIDLRMDLLATKEELAGLERKMDLRMDLLATKEELAAGLDEVRRHAAVLNEDVRDDIRLLAEHLAGLIDKRSRDR